MAGPEQISVSQTPRSAVWRIKMDVRPRDLAAIALVTTDSRPAPALYASRRRPPMDQGRRSSEHTPWPGPTLLVGQSRSPASERRR